MFSLGEIYVSDFLKPDEQPGLKHELQLVMDESIGAARLKTTVPNNTMFGKYWYRSGTNKTMSIALGEIVDSIVPLMKFSAGDVWLDIACNDGTLLSVVPGIFKRIGIDPAEDSIKKEAEKHADVIIQDYFSKELLQGQKAKVITTIAMFYDLEDPDKFIQDVYEVMDDEGLWVLQMSYTPLMIRQLAFDNICHEHVYYHSLSSMQVLMERNGFTIVDCQLNDVNGGSFRIYVRKEKANPRKFASQPYRDVCEFRISSLEWKEAFFNLGEDHIWDKFYENIVKLKTDVVNFMEAVVANGKTIMGYGASTKGNTLLQFFGLDNSLITAIAERSPYKHGLRTVGTNIPIISEEEMRKAKPDYLLILPWHFINEFQERESEYLKAGGKMIVPCPKFEIIG